MMVRKVAKEGAVKTGEKIWSKAEKELLRCTIDLRVISECEAS